MYDYYPSNDNAKRKHQEMIAEAAHDAVVRQQRNLHKSANSNVNSLVVIIANLLTR